MYKSEYTAAYLTPWEIFANNCYTNRKIGAAEISNTSGGGAQVSETRANQGIGSSEVQFHYYRYDKLKTLPKEQNCQLIEWCKYQKHGGKVKKHDQGNSNNKSKTNNKAMKKMIGEAVAGNLSQLAGSDNKYY